MAGKGSLSFKDEIKSCLLKLKLTQVEFADELKVPYERLRSWLMQSRVPIANQKDFARILKVSTDELVSWGMRDERLVEEEILLTKSDLETLLRVQEAMGDLSVSMAVKIIKEVRSRK